MTDRSAFGGGDQNYLRTTQYGDGSKLDVRTQLHQRFSTAVEPFPDFAAAHVTWPSRGDLLDCGTGTGRFWENTFASRDSSLTVTDLSAGMVAEAVDKARANGFASVTGQTCDVQALPFADNAFDVVVANHMLYHVPDPDMAVAELARVVRPGGVAVASTNGYGHMGELNAAITEVFSSTAENLHEVFGIDTGEARLRRAFASVSWHAYDNDLIVTDPEAAIAYGLSFPPGEFATADQRAAFAAAIHDRFVDGAFRIRTRSGVFICRSPRAA